jgi:hypothetical protein
MELTVIKKIGRMGKEWEGEQIRKSLALKWAFRLKGKL